MTTLLAMDTSGPSLSVALLRGDMIVYECTRQTGRTHSEGLMPMVDQAIETAGICVRDVDCFAAVTGPGSFTGVRIGVATAKALAHGTGKPCIGINALEALAAGVSLFDGVVCPLQDARAGQVYAAAFQGETCLLPDAALPLMSFLNALEGFARCCFVGDGAVRHRTAIEASLKGRAVFAPMEAMALRAGCVARLAMARIEQAGDYRALLPYYLRAPQAERERAAREGLHG